MAGRGINKFAVALAVAFGTYSVLIVLAFGLSSAFAVWNLSLRSLLLLPPWGASVSAGPISIVAIDDATLKARSQGGMGRWQNFERAYYAQAITNLKKAGALAIGVDILLSEPNRKEDDLILGKALEDTKNVVLVSILADKHGNEAIRPLDAFAAAKTGFGNVWPLAENGFIYSVSMLATNPKEKEGYEETISLATIREAEKAIGHFQDMPTNIGVGSTRPLRTFMFTGDLRAKYLPIPSFEPAATVEDMRMALSFVTHPSPAPYQVAGFPAISFVDAYRGTFDPNLVRDRIIFIGATATALGDTFLTPVGELPGVAIHANAANTVIQRVFSQAFGEAKEFLLLGCFVLLLALIGVYGSSRFYALMGAFVVTGVFFGVYIGLARFAGTTLQYPLLFLVGIFTVFFLANLWRYFHEDRDKRLLKNALSQYLAKDLVWRVLENYEEVRLGGERRDITIFFSDIRGFTSVSERVEPEEVVRFLSTYLRDMSDIIIRMEGFVNKYEWDAVMALWWAFGEQEHRELRACAAALEQQARVRELSPKFMEQFGVPLSIRIGIHSGPAVVGNVGSLGKKIEFTAIGDSVNIGARLEALNKVYGTSILVSEAIVQATEGHFVFRKLDRVRLRGRDEAVTVYELVGRAEVVEASRIAYIQAYEEALSFYLRGEFVQAQGLFARLAETGDIPSKRLGERIQNLIAAGIDPSQWSGVAGSEE